MNGMPYGSTYNDARSGTFGSAGNIQSNLANMTMHHAGHPSRGYGGGGPHRRRPNTVKPKKEFTCADKHPVMALKELFPAVKFDTTCTYHVQGGAAVVISCSINGVTYQGEGTDSKIARSLAAHKALAGMNAKDHDLVKKVCDYNEQRKLVLERISKWQDEQAKKAKFAEEKEKEEEKQKLEKAERQQRHFLAQQAATMEKEKRKQEKQEKMEVTAGEEDKTIKKMRTNEGGSCTTATHMDYGHLLFKYGPNITETSVKSETKNAQGYDLYKSTLTVQGFVFEACNTSKKKARNEAVAAALAQFTDNPPPVVNEKRKTPFKKNTPRKKRERPEGPIEFTPPVPVEFQDFLAEKCWKTVTEQLSVIPERFRNYRNVVAIVKVEGEDNLENCDVIAFGSGTLLVKKENMESTGEVINDLTGESLALRAFRRYLCTQATHCLAKEESVFYEPGRKQKLKIKEGISFYMYTNSSPMGDCRTISKEGNRIPWANRAGMILSSEEDVGKLRFFKTDEKWGSTEAAFLHGDKSHCIPSPSDKLAMRQICGVQGSILSGLIEPVHMKKHIINRSFIEKSLQRALYDRLKDVPLPKGATLPPAPTITKTEWRATLYATPRSQWSAVWTEGCELEVLLASAGKRLGPEGLALGPVETPPVVAPAPVEGADTPMEGAEPGTTAAPAPVAMIEPGPEHLVTSTYTTAALFRQLLGTCQRYRRSCDQRYSAVKSGDTEYRRLKNAVIGFMKESGLGEWPENPAKPDY